MLTWNQIREIELRQCHLLIACELQSSLLLDRTCHCLHGNRDTLNQQVQQDKRIVAQQCPYGPQDKRNLVDGLLDQDGLEPGGRVDEEPVFVLCDIPFAQVYGELWSERCGKSMGEVNH